MLIYVPTKFHAKQPFSYGVNGVTMFYKANFVSNLYDVCGNIQCSQAENYISISTKNTKVVYTGVLESCKRFTGS